MRTALEDVGVEVSGDWLFIPGIDYGPQIFDAITGSEHLLFVISGDSVRSQPCRNELQEAAKLGKSILSILFRQSYDETELPMATTVPDRSPIPTPIQTEYVLANQRGKRRLLIGLVVTIGCIAVGFFGLYLYANFQRNNAIRDKNIAIARQLIAESAQVKRESPQLSLLPAMKSKHTSAWNKKLFLPEIEENLLGLLKSIGGLPLLGHSTQIRNSRFSPDGRCVISSSSDSVRLWDLSGDEGTVSPVSSLLGQNEGVLDISPDGSLLGTVEGEKAHLRNLRADTPADARVDLPGEASGLIFSPNGHWLLA